MKTRFTFCYVPVLGPDALATAADTWVTVGYGGRRTMSHDGREWAKLERLDEKLGWEPWTGKVFLSGGGKQPLSSGDGRRWQAHPLKPVGKPLWTDGTRFITTSWPGKMAFSPNGTSWLCSPEMTPNGINRVVAAGPFY